MGGAYLNDDVFFLQFDAISNFSSWDVGAGKESGEDALILPHPNTVLKVNITFTIVTQDPKYPFQIVDLMKDRAKREAFLVSDQESLNAKDVLDLLEELTNHFVIQGHQTCQA